MIPVVISTAVAGSVPGSLVIDCAATVVPLASESVSHSVVTITVTVLIHPSLVHLEVGTIVLSEHFAHVLVIVVVFPEAVVVTGVLRTVLE